LWNKSMLWLSNSSFQVLCQSILCFMFPCWNFTKCLPFEEESMIPFHLLKLMVNMNMKWRTFWIQRFIIINSNILFIDMGMMWTNTFGNQWRTYQMPWRKCMSFINDMQTNLNLFLVEFIVRKWCHICQYHRTHSIEYSSMYLTFRQLLIKF
jgi:hypothetical protein